MTVNNLTAVFYFYW